MNVKTRKIEDSIIITILDRKYGEYRKSDYNIIYNIIKICRNIASKYNIDGNEIIWTCFITVLYDIYLTCHTLNTTKMSLDDIIVMLQIITNNMSSDVFPLLLDDIITEVCRIKI